MLYDILRLENNVCVMLKVMNYQTCQECTRSSGQFRMTFLLNVSKYWLTGHSTLKYHITIIPHVLHT